jgi:hypothetical protein
MKAFVCVYQHPIPSKSAWNKTKNAAANSPQLSEFLDRYHDSDFFYDWGDDPGFFAATKLLGDPTHASWGVCRADVRGQLSKGDFIVWVRARSDGAMPGRIEYFFVGVTTVLDAIERRAIWIDPKHAPYRSFYNVLARYDGGSLVQLETFHDYHKNWEHRANKPYILFDPTHSLSRLNLKTPTRIAIRAPGHLLETWLSDKDPRAAAIERTLLLEIGCRRRLRIRTPMNAHRHIPLHKACPDTSELVSLRQRLINLV